MQVQTHKSAYVHACTLTLVHTCISMRMRGHIAHVCNVCTCTCTYVYNPCLLCISMHVSIFARALMRACSLAHAGACTHIYDCRRSHSDFLSARLASGGRARFKVRTHNFDTMCVCVCVCVCASTRARARACARAQAHAHVRTCACAHTCVFVLLRFMTLDAS